MSATPSPRSVLRPLRSAALCVLALTLTGCGMFYRSRARGENHVVYSNRDDDYTRVASANVDEIYEAYLPLFDLERDDLGTTRIYLDGGPEDVVDHTYSPSLLGYYVPLFNVIHIDTESAWAREGDALRQVLLHEVAHHFLVRRHPRAAGQCWLNEGLAGALEVTILRGRRSEYPLLHPVLVRIAQRAATRGWATGELRRLLDMDWSEFHESESKVENYALSWSICYWLLEHHFDARAPLDERLRTLWELDTREIAALEPEWRSFLASFDLTDWLVAAARRSDPSAYETSLWALAQLGATQGLDDPRVLRCLVDLTHDADEFRRGEAALAFLELLERNPHVHFFVRETSRRGVQRVADLLADEREDPFLRAALIERLDRGAPERTRWIAALVPLLSAPHPELRAAAASALSRLESKRTIVSPHFWRYAPATVREREVGEWKRWITAR